MAQAHRHGVLARPRRCGVLSWLSPPRRRLVLSLLVALAVLMTGSAVLLADRTPAALDSPPDVRVPPDQPGPVLLVPGYGGSRALEVLADRLRVEGRQASVLTLPGGGTGDLRQAAAVLDEAADAALAAGAPSVDVVGYSARGLWPARARGARVGCLSCASWARAGRGPSGMGRQRSGQGGRQVVDALRQDGTQLVAGSAAWVTAVATARWLDVGSTAWCRLRACSAVRAAMPTAAPARTSSMAPRVHRRRSVGLRPHAGGHP